MRSFSVERLGPGLLHHRKRLEEAPLVTKAFREAQMKEKLERYPKVSKEVLKFPGEDTPQQVTITCPQVVHSLGSPRLA